MAETRTRPPNSLLLVGDPLGDPPGSMSGRLVAATPTKVAIGTVSDVDGETRIRLTDLSDRLPYKPTYLAFDGVVELPSHTFTVSSVLGEDYITRSVDANSVRLEIWVNDLTEPDDVWIGIE